jgi:hypothetical protein
MGDAVASFYDSASEDEGSKKKKKKEKKTPKSRSKNSDSDWRGWTGPQERRRERERDKERVCEWVSERKRETQRERERASTKERERERESINAGEHNGCAHQNIFCWITRGWFNDVWIYFQNWIEVSKRDHLRTHANAPSLPSLHITKTEWDLGPKARTGSRVGRKKRVAICPSEASNPAC